MIKKLKHKVNSLIGNASGYRGIIFINICILVLVLVLMFIQHNWISKEKDVLKSMIEKQSVSREAEMARPLKGLAKRTKRSIEKKEQTVATTGFSQGRKITNVNIGNAIKEADMYFDYNQHNKAVDLYERVVNSKIAIDSSDRICSRLADSYYRLGKYDKALGMYKKVANNYLNSPYRLSAQLGLGECLILTAEYDEARRILYMIAGQEAEYTEDKDKNIVIEAHYKIADSYIEQAKHCLKKEGMRPKNSSRELGEHVSS